MKRSFSINKTLMPVRVNKMCIFGVIIIIFLYISISIGTSLDKPNVFSSILDYIISPGNVNGGANALAFSYSILPCFDFLIIKFFQVHENNLILYRYGDRKEIWNIKVRNIIIGAIFIMVIVIFFNYIIAVIKMGGANNTWPGKGTTLNKVAMDFKVNVMGSDLLYSTISMLGLTFISGTLGLMVHGFLALSLRGIFNNDIIVYFIMLVITFSDLYSPIKFFTHKMILAPTKMLYGWQIFTDILYLIIISILFYFIGKYIDKKREFY